MDRPRSWNNSNSDGIIMVAYTGIQGQNILIVSSDPSNPTEGQIWYNTTSNTLKDYQFANVNAWAAGGSMNTARNSLGGAGSQTAALAFGGGNTSPGRSNASESYNGTSWTTTPNINLARSSGAGFGLQTAALFVTGNYDTGGNASTNATESFNGSSWTTLPATVANGRNAPAGVGIQTAGIIFGGYTPANGNWAATESYNGSSWTTVNSLNTARRSLGGFGTQTAALGFSGDDSPTATESWNGTSWTTVNSLNTGRPSLAGAGIQTAGLAFGGYNGGPVGTTELWNGTTWTTNPTGLATPRYTMAPAGTTAAALAAGGYNTDFTTATEEWTGQAFQIRTITVS